MNSINLLNLLSTPPENMSLIVLQQLSYILPSFLKLN